MRSYTPEGTLEAVTARLPYIADFGATIVYLSPINRQTLATFGGYTSPYRIADYDAIDPEYGTEADLRALVEEAHRLKLKVLMDIVFYHTGPDSVLMKRPDFYMHEKDGSLLLGRWKLPRLNLQNAELRRYLIGNLLHWAKDVGVDGFRCDVAGGLSVDFWEQSRAELDKVNRELIMLAESDEPAQQLKAFDINYNFSYYDALLAVVRDGEPALRIRAQWQKAHASFPRGARLLHLSDNHDRERADVVFGEKGAAATAVLNFTLDGIPFVYNGQEIADTTPTHHPAHVPIRWDIDVPKGRYPSASSRRQAARLQLYERLFQMRREEAALTAGEVRWLDNSEPNSAVSFVRRKGREEVLVVINLSNRKLSGMVDLPTAEYHELRDLIGQRSLSLPASGKVPFALGAFEYLVAKKLPLGRNE